MTSYRSLLLIVALLVTQVAHAAQPTFVLHPGNISCDEQTIDIDWDDLVSEGPFTVERKQSWRTGWKEVATDLVEYSFAERIPHSLLHTYLYRIAKKNYGTSEFSNTIRVDTSVCDTEPTEEHTASVPTTKEVSHILWGADVGYTAEDAVAFEEQVGKQMTLRTASVYWGNERDFPFDLAQTFSGSTLVLYWNPGDYTVEDTHQPEFSYDTILAGNWDPYIEEFALQIKQYGQPVILVPFTQVNGNWFAWSGTVNGNTAEKHISAYRYIHEFFTDIDNVQFGWSVTSTSVPDIGINSIAGYYPGSDYVDVVGVSGYNYGTPWESFHDVFAPALFTFQVFEKPVLITGVGSIDSEWKADWITDALTVQIPQYKEIMGWIWDNNPYSELYNWKVDSNPASLKAFTEALLK